MQTTTVFLILIGLCLFSFFVGRQRSHLVAMRSGGMMTLHSLPKHYGYMAAAWAALPALLVLLLCVSFEANLVYQLVVADLPDSVRQMHPSQLGLYYNQVQSFAGGAIAPDELDGVQLEAAAHYNELIISFGYIKAILVFLVAIIGAALAISRVTPVLRARNHVENIIKWILFSCSFIAVVTTLGIVLSVLVEAIRFFKVIPLADFLFGLALESADGNPGRPGRRFGLIRLCSAARGYTVDFWCGHADRSAYRPDVGNLPVGIRIPAFPRDQQTSSGNPGRCADGSVRLLCSPDRGPIYS